MCNRNVGRGKGTQISWAKWLFNEKSQENADILVHVTNLASQTQMCIWDSGAKADRQCFTAGCTSPEDRVCGRT